MALLMAMFVCLTGNLFAQSLFPSLIGSAGGSSVGSPEVEMSIGETVTGTADGNTTLISGYFQLDEQIPTPVVIAAKGLSRVRLQRRPGAFKIIFDKTRVEYQVHLFNGKGQDLGRHSIAVGQRELLIPTQGLAAKLMIVRVFNREDRNVQNFRVVK